MKKKQKTKNKKKMQIVGPISSKSTSSSTTMPPFKLPDGWVVERCPRRTNGHSDKYYYDPSTGQKFRSLLSIEKYLSGEIDFARKRLEPGNERNMQIVPHIFRSCSTFNLPDGWIIQEKPRSNINYRSVIDRCYIETGTGKQFRSLISVERYLSERYLIEGKEYEALKPCLTNGKEYTAMPKALKLGDHTVKTSIVDLGDPPAKIKWVLGPGGNAWSPSMDDSRIPESIKHKWFEKFMCTLSDS